ncbi:MAG: methylaspartate mutase subunit S [Clostridia bacterium]|nr:methylaspartate mutase subunit S [Clostridia bacterium]
MTTVVMGVIGADCHAVGNKILDYAFTQGGFHVVNIGVLSSQEDFIQAAEETNAKAILVSSLYGHGEIDCRGLREKCDEAGLNDILLYVGGNLVVGKHDWDEVQKKFQDMGFNRVYAPGTNPEVGIKDLREDLNLPALESGAQ